LLSDRCLVSFFELL